MLYVYFGTDTVMVREHARTRLRSFSDAGSADTVTAAEYRPGLFVELAGGTSLFGTPAASVLDTLSEDPEAFEALIEALPLLAESPRAFVVIESALFAPLKKQFQKHAVLCEEYAAEKKERFNTFALTDALLARDKKALWLLFMDAVRAGISYEEIIGLLMWQLKTLRLAARTTHAEEAGLKPFVYSKAKRALQTFTTSEIDTHARTLLALYHEGHEGKRDIGRALEQWMLAL
jgi:DNA polymerase III delta subunit